MTPDEVIRRCAAKDPRYKQIAGGQVSTPLPVLPKRVLPCIDLGARIPGQPCGSPLVHCNRFGDTTSRLKPCSSAVRDCQSCGHYRTVDRRPAHDLPPPTVGVAIGSYLWPELVDLQLHTIRETCGNVPVIVSNDHPESSARLAEICVRHGNAALSDNPERIGHTGGDMAVFGKGIRHFAMREVDYFAKLSQRWICTVPNWLQDGAEALRESGLPLSTQATRGLHNFPLRTEACLLDVRRWNRPEVLERLAPRERWTGRPAEWLVDDILREHLGGKFWPWSVMDEDRFKSHPNFVWHNGDTVERYRVLAKQYGVVLPADFTCKGWEWQLAKGEYKYG